MSSLMSSQQDLTGRAEDDWSPQAAVRLKDAIARFGRQSDFAEEVGISRSALAAILNNGVVPRRSNLIKICARLGVDINDILRPSGSQNTMVIREVDLAYGLGGTFVDDVSASVSHLEMPREWIRQFTVSPEDQLFLCKGIGDSMMPTLLDSDGLLIDQNQRRVTQSDRIWVLTVGDVGMVKRLRARPDGSYSILSDNPQVPEMNAADGEMAVIGRVVAIVRKL